VTLGVSCHAHRIVRAAVVYHDHAIDGVSLPLEVCEQFRQQRRPFQLGMTIETRSIETASLGAEHRYHVLTPFWVVRGAHQVAVAKGRAWFGS
jgi:hypothetical protein